MIQALVHVQYIPLGIFYNIIRKKWMTLLTWF